MTELELDFTAKYKVDGYGSIAFYLTGYEKTRDEDYEWSGIEDINYDRVTAIMVGDDTLHHVDVSDLTPLNDDDYCRECGQIGCKGDGR